MALVVRGVGWPRGEPLLGVTDTDTGEVTSRPVLSSALRYRALDAPGVMWCIGRRAEDGRPVACPNGARATSGVHCDACVAADPYRFVHIVHRQDFLSKGLESVVMQPHWLYVATFADGTDKVGTAADPRKWGRLTEQGAVVGRYVARAVDGRVVRHLEDAMTDTAGLRQAVRAAAKAAGLTRPIDLARLDRSNADAATLAREVLADLGPDFSDDDFRVVDEQWEPPAGREAAFTGRRTAYPLDTAVGAHGLTVQWCIGSAVGATVAEDPDAVYVADLARLRGRRIEWGEFDTALPAMQEALF
ncbi:MULTISPECIES: DUF2797 domain-containing protein [unclassified Rhodococcus (in: high G+C Gram-positive bacteria)]|uniref:DUF2797 domain-containing protein n=1 Tax=unclassified Rhodococcus (in: high G+C Gram-positive bacteria) TaxID=192944 RepID=UPI000B20DC93|nr:MULTISPECIES: DUF2797 domain-containing protein [unclassified Rhodococcus (in: high G+C Gram-positive bacteria)]